MSLLDLLHISQGIIPFYILCYLSIPVSCVSWLRPWLLA